MIDGARVPDDVGALVVSPRAYARQRQLLAGFRWLRANNPIGRVEIEGFDPFWAVTRHADIIDVASRHDLFHNGDRGTALVPRAADEMARDLTGGSPHVFRSLLHMDAPHHGEYRRITQAWFTQQKVAALADRIRAVARCSIDRMAARADACDFVRDIAIHYPLRVIMEMLGVPAEDDVLMLGATQDLFRSQDEELGRAGKASRDPTRHTQQLSAAFAEFRSYFTPLMEARRKAPRDDLASVVANAGIDGQPICPLEAMSYYMIFATAGHHTVASAISGAIWALCENPDEFRKIKADAGLIASLVEEAVRWTTPAQHVMRTATKDTQMRGRRIARGDWLMLCHLSGNRDEEAFEQPERFCVDRGWSRNVAFGHGVHACLGQHLARLEMRIFFEELLARLEWIEMAGTPRRSASLYVGGPKSLPVRFKML